jgi:hypothetical protein
MRIIIPVALAFCLFSCRFSGNEKQQVQSQFGPQCNSVPERSYTELKDDISEKRKQFAVKYSSVTLTVQVEISDYWINAISNEIYSKWQNTPWDFNGIATEPQQGTIACGYFVTTILRDMDLRLNRIKLSTCASSEMMKSLTPQQKIKNLSYLSYSDFNDAVKAFGKGVYIIGLDFHTGFIVNDGTENLFIHSNYIGRKGVTKETVLSSAALKASKTRWLVSLTSDKNFLQRWLKG